jgi:hypothetical protein
MFDFLGKIAAGVVSDLAQAVVDPFGDDDKPDDIAVPIVRAIVPGLSALNAALKDDDK